MKGFLLVAVLMAFMVGCSASRTQKTVRYTVFTPQQQHTLAAQPPKLLPVAGVRVRMTKELRAYNTPLRFNADGTVTPYRALTYYAPLELVLERALEDITRFQASEHRQLGIEVRDYCIVESASSAESLQPPAAEVRVTLVFHLPSKAPVTHAAVLPLPENYTPAIARETFAEALLRAWQAYTP